jgi:DNA-binding NarL/FixJ family response regulator
VLRILIADEQEIVRRGVRALIERRTGWEVCAEASNGQQALELALALREKPDVAIIDIAMPVLNGVALTRRLLQELPRLRIIIFTLHNDDESIGSALAAGARGYILKTDSEEQLQAAISSLAANRPYFSAFVSELLLEAVTHDGTRSRLDSFTVRELEVGQLIAEGNSNKQVAIRLGISVKTVEAHRGAAMRKAGVHSAAEFVRFAIKHHLISP